MRAVLIIFLFLASAYCLLGVLCVADLSMPDDPHAVYWACGWLVGSILLAAAAIWQLDVLSRQHPTIQESDRPAGG